MAGVCAFVLTDDGTSYAVVVGDPEPEMSTLATMHEREQAAQFIHVLGEHMPSNLRSPLARVREGTEVEGTAGDVLAFARDALARIAPDRLA